MITVSFITLALVLLIIGSALEQVNETLAAVVTMGCAVVDGLGLEGTLTSMCFVLASRGVRFVSLCPGPVQGAPLSTAGLTGIPLYEPGALTLVAQAGTPVAEIEAALAAEGQLYQPLWQRSASHAKAVRHKGETRRVKGREQRGRRWRRPRTTGGNRARPRRHSWRRLAGKRHARVPFSDHLMSAVASRSMATYGSLLFMSAISLTSWSRRR